MNNKGGIHYKVILYLNVYFKLQERERKTTVIPKEVNKVKPKEKLY